METTAFYCEVGEEVMELRPNVSRYDLIRIGAYTQMDGNFRYHNNSGYRFTFFLHQIEDIKDLLKKTLYIDEFPNKTYTQFYSKTLYEALKELGFYTFKNTDWNIPKVINQSESYRTEYMRAVIDSIGTVDINTTKGNNIPVVKIMSANKDSLLKIRDMYGGKFYEWKDRANIQWRGKETTEILDKMNWIFHCYHNQHGANLISQIKWENFVW